MSPIARLLRDARRMGLGLIVAACSGAALGGMPMGIAGDTPTAIAAYASEATGGSRSEATASPAAAGEPARLTAGVGSMQSTPAGTRFPIRLAVTATDADGNPVPGVLVTFSAPVAGAGGRFAVAARHRHRHRAGARRHNRHRARGHRSRRHRARGSHTVEVETNASGIAVAPVFTANDTRGGYIVKATAEHARPAAFALVNEARGRS